MKFYNKFIAIGLGIAISFTGTNMVYTWFTDKATLNENIISFGDLYEEILEYIETDTCIYGSKENRDKNQMCLTLPKEFDMNAYVSVDSLEGKGKFKGISYEDDIKNELFNNTLFKKTIHLSKNSSLSNNIEYDKDYVKVTLKDRESSKTYIVKFDESAVYSKDVECEKDYHYIHGYHKHLKAHWYLVETRELNKELDNEGNTTPDQDENILPNPGQTSNPDISYPTEPEKPGTSQPINPDLENNDNEIQSPIPEQEEQKSEEELVTLKSE